MITVEEVLGGIPVDITLRYIEKYIYEKKGVRVKLIPPRNRRELQLFERAANVALTYYGL